MNKIIIAPNNQLTEFKSKLNKTLLKLTFNNYFINLEEKDSNEDKKANIEIKLFKPQKYPAPFWYYDYEKNKHIVALPNIDLIFLNEEMEYNKYKNEEYNKEIYQSIHSLLHELGHAHFSDKAIQEIKKELNKYDVPFDVINILEDIRIENLMSKYYLNNLPLFKWSLTIQNTTDFSIEKIDIEDDFWTIIIKLLKTQGLYSKDSFKNPLFCQIEPYIAKAKKANSTKELIPISIEFYNVFKKYFSEQKPDFINKDMNNSQDTKDTQGINNSEDINESNQNSKKQDTQDIQNKQDINESNQNPGGLNKKQIEEILKDAENFEIDFTQINEFDKERKIFELEEPYKYIKITDSNNIIFTPKRIKKILLSPKDFYEVEKIKKELFKIKQNNKIEENFYSFESNNFNIDKLIDFNAGDLEAPFALRTKQKKINELNLHILVDLSGSMFNYASKIAIILYAFNKFKQLTDKSDIKITFSKAIINKYFYQTFKAPIPLSIINDIYQKEIIDGDSEGFAKAIQELYKNKKANLYLFLTDLMVSEDDEKELKKFLKKNQKNTYILYPSNTFPRKVSKLNYIDENKIIFNNELVNLIKIFINYINTPDVKLKNSLKPKR